MPCNSDYLEASGVELESQRVCQCICYLYGRLSKEVPEWITKAAGYYYGNKDRLDEATKILCGCCRSLTTEEVGQYIYDAHNSEARELANWWERHQEWDKRRVAEEDEIRRKIMLKDRALKKLTVDEIKALGLSSTDNFSIKINNSSATQWSPRS